MNRYLNYFIIELLVVALVILTFRVIEDRRMAASMAGMMFLFIPLVIILKETLKHRSRNWLFLAGHLQFLLLFAFPIMALRMANQNQPFAELSIGPITGQQLHNLSNYSYFLMMFTTLNARRSFQRQLKINKAE